METLRFPIGRYQPGPVSDAMLADCILTIEHFPAELRKVVASMTAAQLATRYRPNGWTARQVVHHCADSHLNSFVRFKLALTEDEPVIKPYNEALWAELPDSQIEISASLLLLEGLHSRWAYLLRSLSRNDLQRTFIHPEHGSKMILDDVIGFYAWHCRHHLAHVESVSRM